MSDSKNKKVLILFMPLANPNFTGLGAALVRTILNRDNVPCDISYAHLLFSKLIDSDPLVEDQLVNVAQSELIFAPYYFNSSLEECAEKLYQYTKSISQDSSGITLERFKNFVHKGGECLDQVMNDIEWENYDIVGFSVLKQQTVASLAMAKKIKEKFPHIKIIFGGANASQPMGNEILRSFPEVDYIFEGEVDGFISQAINEIRLTPDGPFQSPGLSYRNEKNEICNTRENQPFFDLDTLPVPDYQPYFDQLEAYELKHVQPTLSMEASRGCWWGEKKHCSFCGLSDESLKFRSKSEEKVIEDVLTISARHQYTDIFFIDNIINYKFYKTLLPDLAYLREHMGYDLNFFFESKSNIDRQHARYFRTAGVNSVQPGIESFSNHILSLMQKGNTGIRQVQCLKFLAEQSININWNIIYKIPHETPEDYKEQIKIIPFIHHIQPLHSGGYIPMQLNRFAPYQACPEKYGIKNVRPKEFYSEIFNDKNINFNNFAYYFDYDIDNVHQEELGRLHIDLDEALRLWRNSFRENSLTQRRGPGFIEIIDRRIFYSENEEWEKDREEVMLLDGVHAEIFTFIDTVRSLKTVIDRFSSRLEEDKIKSFLNELYQKRLAYRNNEDQYINLPLLMEAYNFGYYTYESKNEEELAVVS